MIGREIAHYSDDTIGDGKHDSHNKYKWRRISQSGSCVVSRYIDAERDAVTLLLVER